jgi:hypothetical protein
LTEFVRAKPGYVNKSGLCAQNRIQTTKSKSHSGKAPQCAQRVSSSQLAVQRTLTCNFGQNRVVECRFPGAISA